MSDQRTETNKTAGPTSDPNVPEVNPTETRGLLNAPRCTCEVSPYAACEAHPRRFGYDPRPGSPGTDEFPEKRAAEVEDMPTIAQSRELFAESAQRQAATGLANTMTPPPPPTLGTVCDAMRMQSERLTTLGLDLAAAYQNLTGDGIEPLPAVNDQPVDGIMGSLFSHVEAVDRLIAYCDEYGHRVTKAVLP